MSTYDDLVARGRSRHGERFDPADLADQFKPSYRQDVRIKVRDGRFPDSLPRTGVVGVTTGWRPTFLLMHRTSDHGSSDVLSIHDRIIAVKPRGAREYTTSFDRRWGQL